MVNVLVHHILKNIADVFFRHKTPDDKACDAEQKVKTKVHVELIADCIVLLAVDFNHSEETTYYEIQYHCKESLLNIPLGSTHDFVLLNYSDENVVRCQNKENRLHHVVQVKELGGAQEKVGDSEKKELDIDQGDQYVFHAHSSKSLVITPLGLQNRYLQVNYGHYDEPLNQQVEDVFLLIKQIVFSIDEPIHGLLAAG